jgi:lysyl-tRNA synthetase class 2
MTLAPGRSPASADDPSDATVRQTRPSGPPGRKAAERVFRLGSRYLDVAPRLLSRVAALVGLFVMVGGLWEHPWRMFTMVSFITPETARATVDAVVVVSGLLLLRIAAGLRKRKRAAWQLAVVACAAIIAADVVRPERRPGEAIATAALLAALVAARTRFTALPDPRSRWFAATVAVQFFLVAVSYGLVMLYLPGHVPANVGFLERLREVVFSIVGLGGWIPIRGEVFADTFHATLAGFGLLTLAYCLVLLLRAREPVAVLSDEDEGRIRDLLRRHGDTDSLGYFALRRDKAVVWSPTGKAGIAYRVVLGVALASGDPIGDIEAWPGAIASFRDLVDTFGWTPAVMGCSARGAIVYRRELGLMALTLGDEAILNSADFSLNGRPMRAVRQPCVRVERAGYCIQIRRVHDVPPEEIEELRTAAAAWRADEVERGFSMALSRLGDPADPDCIVVTARREGALSGLLHFVPWSDNGISLDLMRRDRTSDNGLNEFMIAKLMQACPEMGIEKVSLNFAVFRDALERGAQIGAGPILRFWRRLLLVASRWWQIETLYRFNAKFQPEWQPRFISYPAARDVPRIALAALEAEAFIVRPALLKRLAGRR